MKNEEIIRNELFEAIRGQRLDRVREILTDSPEVLEVANFGGATPIHDAARFGSTETLEYIIGLEPDLDAGGDIGSTVLHEAVSSGRIGNVAPLVDKCLKQLNTKDDIDGRTPLHYCQRREIAELLVSKGAKLNISDKWGYYPIHTCLDRDAEVLRFFIDLGLDIDTPTTKRSGSMSILYCAILSQNSDAIKFLLDKGATVDDSILDQALEMEDEEIFDLIKDAMN